MVLVTPPGKTQKVEKASKPGRDSPNITTVPLLFGQCANSAAPVTDPEVATMTSKTQV